ncbi:SaV-like [uncultured Caudovirales phage]|uniref:SaV-like n=1 Tax=uncultured Caudovirales phage TaxID=2100421 RepID=A0A6J5LSE0_9CAUD|nr:SaV-like [uncultured Caudovirales phage]
MESNSNMVDHPAHYQGKSFEVIDIINDYKLNFEMGNAIKYILRADKKGNKKQDIEKAIWYLNHELSKFIG